METYLVGGAVRDQLLGNEPSDHDYVVVGATPSEMEELGFKEVGQDFPVFLDSNGNEYALARVEKKTGQGYNGFEAEWRDVTLREDLKRRDFTVNAMALEQGDGPFEDRLIDPFNGRKDLGTRTLRHVSEAFREDPLRVVRLARFASRLGFTVARETVELAREVAPRIRNLPGERVGEEVLKAMEQADRPSTFFGWLDEVEALRHVMPELKPLQEVSAGPDEWHKEGSAFTHSMMVADEVADRTGDPVLRLAGMLHDLGKFLTDTVNDGHHGRHDVLGKPLVDRVQERLKLSNDTAQVLKDVVGEHMRALNLPEMRSSKVIRLVKKLDSDKHLDPEDLVVLVEADRAGRRPSQTFDTERFLELVGKARDAINEFSGQDLIDEGFEPGPKIGDLLLERRTKELKRTREKNK